MVRPGFHVAQVNIALARAPVQGATPNALTFKTMLLANAEVVGDEQVGCPA
jgi:hypothetical protein